MTSSHLFSGCRPTSSQTCAEDVQAAYGLLDSPGEAEWGVQLKDNWTLAMLWEEGFHPARIISSTQTPSYTSPHSGCDRAKHKHVWQGMDLSPRSILPEEGFYFAFGVKLSGIYNCRITRSLPEGKPRMLVSKMQSLAWAAVGLTFVEARLKASPHRVFRKDDREYDDVVGFGNG